MKATTTRVALDRAEFATVLTRRDSRPCLTVTGAAWAWPSPSTPRVTGTGGHGRDGSALSQTPATAAGQIAALLRPGSPNTSDGQPDPPGGGGWQARGSAASGEGAVVTLAPIDCFRRSAGIACPPRPLLWIAPRVLPQCPLPPRRMTPFDWQPLPRPVSERDKTMDSAGTRPGPSPSGEQTVKVSGWWRGHRDPFGQFAGSRAGLACASGARS